MRRPTAVTAASALALAGLTLLPVLGVSAPATAAGLDQAISGVPSAMWQTDASVDALAVSNGIVYAGGTFTHVRPPGTAVGDPAEVSRTYVAAFNASTGALVTGFDVTLDAKINDLAVSPDGSTLYLAGAFGTVDGQAKRRVAAVDATTGALDAGFTADANAFGTALAAVGSSLYVGGDFTTINGSTATRLARVNATTGGLDTSFTASLDDRPLAIDPVPTSSRVLIGGQFTTVNGTTTGGMASVDLTGAVQPWAANSTQSIALTCAGRVTSIVDQDGIAYVTAEGDPPGCFEGTYSATISTGALNWISSCLGAAQGLAIVDNILYKASHQHDCAYTLGGAYGGYAGGVFSEDLIHWHLVGQAISTGAFVHWTPDTNASGSLSIGPHAIATDGTQLFVGGDFTTVENGAQQGLTRFAPGSAATPKQPDAPTVVATKAGQLTVTFPATYDPDNGTLTYRVYRTGGGAAVNVYTTTNISWPWTRPVMRYDDRGLTAGRTYSYYVIASDGTHSSAASVSTAGTVSAAVPATLSKLVVGLPSQAYWRMDTTVDSSGQGNTMSPVGAQVGTTGVTSDSKGRSLTGGYFTSAKPLTLARFSTGVWFKTSTTSGGSIIAMSTAQRGPTGTTDRAIVMDNNGGLVFQLRRAGTNLPLGQALVQIRQQEPTYNNGRWHFAVGTYDGSTASFYVDGSLIGTATGAAAGNLTPSYLRVGYTKMAGMSSIFGYNYYNRIWPASYAFTGVVDEAFMTAGTLTAGQVRSLYAAGVNQGG